MTIPPAARRLVPASHAIRAVLLMAVASAFLASMHGMVRFLSTDLHPFEIAFFRNLFGFLFFLPWLLRQGIVLLSTRRFGTHVLRATLNSASMLAWFMALSLIPLADATALSLTGPLYVMLGAMIFLGESVGRGRWFALFFGAAGALVIIRPGFQTVEFGVILAVLAPSAAAVAKLFAKSLTRTESPVTVAAYLALLMTPMTLIPALFVWQTPGWGELAALAVVGAFGSIGHLSFVKAYAIADISLVEPAVFTRMVWAALIGYLAFAEAPDNWTWAGAAMIVGAICYVAAREHRSREGAGADTV